MLRCKAAGFLKVKSRGQYAPRLEQALQCVSTGLSSTAQSAPTTRPAGSVHRLCSQELRGHRSPSTAGSSICEPSKGSALREVDLLLPIHRELVDAPRPYVETVLSSFSMVLLHSVRVNLSIFQTINYDPL